MKRVGTGQDDGASMIIVVGVGLAMLAFALLASATAVTGLKDSRSHAVFAQSLDSAEAGIDQVSARLQKTNGTYSYCPTTSNVPSCDIPAAARVSGFATPSAETNWAKDTLTQLAKDNQGLLSKSSVGQYLTIKPPSINTIYSMSWVPNYKQATRTRLVKSEYIFSTYRPANAILTNGNITCCPSYNVGLAPGVPTSTVFAIHTNGSLTGVPATTGSAFSVTASASGTCSSPCTPNTATQTVPAIDPRAIYNSQSAAYAANWYDLCPDGKVRAPSTGPVGVPCTGAILSNALPFRGWSKSGNTWTPNSGNNPGVYYVYQGNIDDKSGATLTGAMTILTEATANRSCPRTDGNQSFKKTEWLSGGFISGLMVVAGGNFKQFTQAHMGSGAILAQGSVEQQTSSAPGVTGLMIAEDHCGETNSLQGSILFYDGGDDLPLGSLIRSTLELELR